MKKPGIRKVFLLFFVIYLLFSTYPLRAVEFVSNGSPVTFLENKGQWNFDILYKCLSASTNISLLNNGLSFSQRLKGENGTNYGSAIVWNMKFKNSNANLQIQADSGKKSVYSYLSGNDPEKWVIHPMEYSAISYRQLYKNIDLKCYGNGNELEYDFLLYPGSKISSINILYEGIKNLRISENGDLMVSTLHNIQSQKTPIAWQEIKGVKHKVKVEYVIMNDSTFGFMATEGYDNNYTLVIDPLFQMVWSSYTKATGGSNNINYCFSNAMDKFGNVYLTGMVDGTFPTTPGSYSGPGSISPEIFVAKFASDGTTLIYGTYLPGNSSEHGIGIAVDDSGRAYLTGVVDLNITGLTNYPSTGNAYQPVHNAGSDAFLTVLNSAGSNLVYSSFLGGSGSEAGYSIALGDPGIAYITGRTSIGNFPVKASVPFPSGDLDVFVAKFDINQSGNNSLIYSTRIGGGAFSHCHGRSIAVNAAGNAFITGVVFGNSGTTIYPLSPGAYNSIYNTGQDGTMSFVTKLSNTLPVTISYSTFLGPGSGNAIKVDKLSNEAYVVGSTRTFSFPVTSGALQEIHGQDALGNPNSDAFLLKLNSTGTALVYSTFLGGPSASGDAGTGLAINRIGEAYVTGIATDFFPTSPGSIQPNNAGTYDFFAVHVNASGTGYGCGGSTYIGGSSADYTGSFYDYSSPQVSIMDHGGVNDTICISSTTHSQDFPTTPGSYAPVKLNGIADQPVFFKLSCFSSVLIPVSSFSSNDSVAICNESPINFFDMSSNNPTSWRWYFPGAVPNTSTLQNPTGIYYPASGTFDVILVACNAGGCDSVVFPASITKHDPPMIPIVTVNGDTLCTSLYAGYKWYETSNPTVILSTDPCLITSIQGNYLVQVFDTNGCKTSSIPIIVNIDEEFQFIPEILIYPNPIENKAVMELDLTKGSDLEIKIIDNFGRNVLSTRKERLNPGKHILDLDLSQKSSGIYFVSIILNNFTRTIKLVKD